jgi:hypothetical protein
MLNYWQHESGKAKIWEKELIDFMAVIFYNLTQIAEQFMCPSKSID